jgi:tRNA dimethylallyltransferase
MVAKVAPLVAIVGPTASGKTSFAIEVAKNYNGEIICADSRTIYKDMDIGTAKPSPNELNEVPHHLIGFVEPYQEFTVADFKLLANKLIDDIWKRGKLPIMVGGSGLYINSVIYDYSFGPPADTQLRDKLNLMTIDQLQKMCTDLGIYLPENSKNKRYLIRAIEIGPREKANTVVRNNTLIVGINVTKENLKLRIEKRIDTMLTAGVVEEVKINSKKYGWEIEPMKSNIYRALRDYIDGQISLDEARAAAIQTDLRLAKKQKTWFKRNKYIVWGNMSDLLKTIDNFVKNIN